VLALVLLGCGGDDNGGTNPTSTPASLDLSPSSVPAMASLGLTAAINAQVRDGDGDLIPNTSVNFISRDAAVASVTPASGTSTTVTGNANGTTRIVAELAAGGGTLRDSVTVTVQQAFAAVAVTLAQSSLAPGGTTTATAQARDGNARALTNAGTPVFAFTSSNTTVADVDAATGAVTAKAAGTTNIGASATIGGVARNGSAALTVTGPASQIHDITTTLSTFSPNALTIKVGDQVRFTIANTNHTVTFSSNAPPGGNIGALPNGAPVGTVELRTFNTVGVANFQCLIHAGMTGAITVTP
jgi:plastocyanin